MRSKRVVLNIMTTLLLKAVVLICGFIIPKLIIENYGSNVNGLVSSITQFLAHITLLEVGFGAVVKAALYKPIAQKDKGQIENILKTSKKFFNVIGCIFIIYLIILSIVYPIVVNTQFTFIYTMSLILIISISTIAEYYFGMTYKLYLQANQKIYITSIIQIVTYILNVVIIVLLVKHDVSIHIVKLVSSIIFVLRPIVQNIYVKKKYNINLKNADKKYDLKQKWDGLAQHIASVVHNNTDIIILTLFLPITEVSVYSVYYLVLRGIKMLIQSVSGSIEPTLGDMIAKNEKERLNKVFKTYELIFFVIISILYICTLILIVPFVKVYTLGINDANYIRPIFGGLLVLAEFVWAIRLPYSGITIVAGHFKQTKKGAWIESIINIIISLVLVWKFGIVGVAVGTLVAMVIRTIEFMYHTNKYILGRKQRISFVRIGIIILETVMVILVSKLSPTFEMNSYISWIKYACIIALITIVVVIPINLIVYRRDIRSMGDIIKSIFSKDKGEKNERS